MLNILAHGGRITWDELFLVLVPLLILIIAFVRMIKTKAGANNGGVDEEAGERQPPIPAEKNRR